MTCWVQQCMGRQHSNGFHQRVGGHGDKTRARCTYSDFNRWRHGAVRRSVLTGHFPQYGAIEVISVVLSVSCTLSASTRPVATSMTAWSEPSVTAP
jgi:hypothetical protein